MQPKVIRMPRQYTEQEAEDLRYWVDQRTLEEIHEMQRAYESRPKRILRRVLEFFIGRIH